MTLKIDETGVPAGGAPSTETVAQPGTSQEQQQQPVAPKPGEEGYEQFMAEKYLRARGATDEDIAQMFGKPAAAPETTKVEEKPEPKHVRPAHVPEKFWNAETGEINTEALLKSYTEMEKRGSQKPAPKSEGEQTETTEGDDAAKDAVEKAGLDWNTIVEKVNTTGTLDDSDIEALEKSGVPRALVDEYMALREEKLERQTNDAIEQFGGPEKTTAIMQWASKNLPESQKAAYNAMLAGSDWKVAVDTLSTLYAKANPADPKSYDGAAPGGNSVTGYRSEAERQKDLRDPRYRTDPSFREAVMQKTQFATWDLDKRASRYE